MDIDDITLAKAKRKDMLALKTIFETYQLRMYRLALSFVKQQATAEDMVQNSYLKVMEKIDQYRGDSHIWYWIRTIVSNECLNYMRKEQRVDYYDTAIIENSLDLVADGIEYDDENIEGMMARLPEQAQHIVYLYVVEGMTHNEIASLFDQSASFSKSIVSRSLKKLRGWMQ